MLSLPACRSILKSVLERTLRLRLIKNIRLLRVTCDEITTRHAEIVEAYLSSG